MVTRVARLRCAGVRLGLFGSRSKSHRRFAESISLKWARIAHAWELIVMGTLCSATARSRSATSCCQPYRTDQRFRVGNDALMLSCAHSSASRRKEPISPPRPLLHNDAPGNDVSFTYV